MLTDEEMDEMGYDIAAEEQAAIERQQRLDTEVAEDIERQQREADYALAWCEHRNLTPIYDESGEVALNAYCYDCKTYLPC
jgi:hypothetical protein